MMERDEALRLVEVENRPRYATIKWYVDAVDDKSAIETINRIPKLYP
jgi:glutamine---fructose-6-phosphate transaminase (isomerizing)